VLAKQMFYCLSHTSSPFCSGYFGDGGGLMKFLPRLASSHDPPNLSLPSSWDYRCEPPVGGTETLDTYCLM
jgi:hypothetical protein